MDGCIRVSVDPRPRGRLYPWIHGRLDPCMGGPAAPRMLYKCMGGPMDPWTALHVPVYGWTRGSVDGYIRGSVDLRARGRYINVWVDPWIRGRLYPWMGGPVDPGPLYKCMGGPMDPWLAVSVDGKIHGPVDAI